jgi:hypothetical protein
MKKLLKIRPSAIRASAISNATLLRAGGLLCALCFVFLCGCPAQTSCEIVVSGPGSLCNIRYTDNESVTHNLVVQSDSEIITIDDCDEVLEVNCS